MGKRIKGVKDSGWNKNFKKVLGELAKLDAKELHVGFSADGADTDEAGKPNIAQIAAWNEFGTTSKNGNEHIPARPFMRNAFDNNKEAIEAYMAQMFEQVAMGNMTADEALENIGTFQAELIRHEIEAGDFVENDPRTIERKERKGSSKPLIDTGRMRQSVQHVIKG